jgi:hypothetical protein
MQMKIPIDIEVLKSVLRIDDEAAQQKINQTKAVSVDDEPPIVSKRQKDEFTVEASTNRSDGVSVINLLDEHGGIITPLAVDLKTGKFRQLEPDPKPAASAKANPQADPGRDLGLALQIGNRTAVTAFLKHHPKGFYADLAKAQLEKIETEEAAAKKP